jgi:hypothetical protein
MSQDLSTLREDQTPVECLAQAFPNQTEARRYLASYLLAGDEVLKPMSLLSYGQPPRLELAVLIVNGCNLLLLDEPSIIWISPAARSSSWRWIALKAPCWRWCMTVISSSVLRGSLVGQGWKDQDRVMKLMKKTLLSS